MYKYLPYTVQCKSVDVTIIQFVFQVYSYFTALGAAIECKKCSGITVNLKYIGLQWFTVLCTHVSMCPIFTVCWHKTAILAQPETALIVCCETLGPKISGYNFKQAFTTLGFSMETTNWSLGRNRLSFVNHKCTARVCHGLQIICSQPTKLVRYNLILVISGYFGYIAHTCF